MKVLKALFLLTFFLSIDVTGRCYGQTSCSAPSCPTLTITGPLKVSYGESKSYTLTGASSSQNIRWSVDNPNASITGNNSGATLAVGSACNCNSGAITITAKDTGTGCSGTFRVQAGTWVLISDVSYNPYPDQIPGVRCCTDMGTPNGCIVTRRQCDHYTSNTYFIRYDWGCGPSTFCSGTPEYCPTWINPAGCDDPWNCEASYYQGQPYKKILQRKREYQWKCPTTTQQCSTPCSLGITDFKTSSSTFDPYSETICLNGLIDEATNKSVGWTIDIKDNTGKVVKNFSGGAAYAGATWDGRDNNGKIVPGANYRAILSAKTGDGKCTAKAQIDITVESCDLKITGFSGNKTTIDPASGGVIKIEGSIFDSSGDPISWEVTLPNEKKVTGSGKSVNVTWDGKDKKGKVMKPEPGQTIVTQATLRAWKTDEPDCKDSKPAKITIKWVKDECKLQVTFGSSANLASGNLSHNQELFATKGAGLAANMTLYYNSLDSYSGALGTGWSYNYDMEIGESPDGYVIMREGDGARRIYTATGNGYASQPGGYSALTKNADGTFTVTHKDGTRYNFNSINKIASIVDRNGNTMSFTYNADDPSTGSGQALTTITDSAGRTTTITYNEDHRISTINDPSGNTHSFTYSGNDLIGVSTLNSELGTLNWVYSYYDNSFMQTKTDPNGYTTTYTYDESHRVISGTDPEGSVKSITYPSPDDTSQTKTSTVTEKDGGVWTYTYDTQAGTLTKKIDPDNGTTNYTYDANKNMTSKTEADGTATTYTYDASGNMTSTTDALNQTTSYTYNSYGQATSITASDGTTTSYEYDTSGNLTKTTDSTGAATSYKYDSKGNVTSITNAAGQTTTFTYDQSGNLSSIKDSTGATTTFTYDAVGNMTSQTDASGSTTKFEYNSLNQLVKVIDPNGNSTTNAYDKNGNKTSSTDGNGNVTYYEYNYKGQLTKVKDALGNVTTYTYGGTGCTSCGGTDNPSTGSGQGLTVITDGNGNTTKYEYDTLGRLTKETDPLGNSIAYSYDSKGNLISKTDANGAAVSYSYDSLGRLLKKTYPDTTTEAFTYDSKGNILTAKNSNISYSLSYNTNGKVTSVTDSSGRTVSYQYDTLGNKTKLTYPEGSTAAYSYDSANRLTKITNGGGKTYSFTYDSLGRRTKLSLPNGTSANYSYDTSSRLTSLAHKTSNSTIASFTYTHDKVGNRLTKALDTGTNYTYSYDAIYRLTEALSSTPGYSSNTTGKGSGVPTATQQQKEFYTYDPVGNRLSSDKYSSYTYNQANQLQTNGGIYSYDKNGNLTTKIEGATVFSYSYDYENRLIKVIKTESNTTTTSEYKYDPFGRRIEKKVTESGTTTTTKYVYDNEDIILEYDGNNNTGNRYVHGPGIDEPLAVINGKSTYYYHADGLGSIVALTDSNGKIQQTYEYDSFGNLKDQKNKVKQPYTYTGREWDKEAGLYYYRARYYDPMAGRFVSADPLLHPANGQPKVKSCSQGGHPTFNELMKKPQRFNPYTYVENRPTALTDPSGLSAVITPGNSGWNGNFLPGFSPQDNVCSSPADGLNSNPCNVRCCQEHDNCYARFGCNASSWFGNLLGIPAACQLCNTRAVNCISRCACNL